ncbi:MAG: Phosphopantetheine adenylyltransferase [Gammaproteobacteria bacterium]|jgi:pantetheine-phosphate adenylyltransferase|nr:Phosphopantetheine adenylyltransferase [Gammaproteobacteria bacterium]
MNIAVYPGTFDPLTFGHMDIIARTSRLFDRLIIAVAPNSSKNPLLSVEQRIAVIKATYPNQDNIEVMELNGLLVDFAMTKKAQIIVRGLRSSSDFDYEFQLAGMNHKLNDQIETLFLRTSEHYAYISSSLVREIVKLGGDVSQFVPEIVLKVLADKA